MNRLSFATVVAVAATLAILALPRPGGGQAFYPKDTPKFPQARTWVAQRAKLPPYTAPRTPDGVPDLQGTWNAPVGGGNDDLEEHEYVDVTTPPQESYVADPPDGKVPYTPWALAKRNEIRAGLGRGWPGETGRPLYNDPAALCMVGMPRWAFGVQEIVQRPGYVILLTAATYRVIPTTPRAPIDSGATFFFGNSRGHWEGDTLVVEVTNLNGETWLDSAGNFYTPKARMVERWTRVEANTIDYQITIEDPTVYTRPWTMTYPKRRAMPGADPYAKENWEQTCTEGNPENVTLIRNLGYRWFDAVRPPQ